MNIFKLIELLPKYKALKKVCHGEYTRANTYATNRVDLMDQLRLANDRVFGLGESVATLESVIATLTKENLQATINSLTLLHNHTKDLDLISYLTKINEIQYSLIVEYCEPDEVAKLLVLTAKARNYWHVDDPRSEGSSAKVEDVVEDTPSVPLYIREDRLPTEKESIADKTSISAPKPARKPKLHSSIKKGT